MNALSLAKTFIFLCAARVSLMVSRPPFDFNVLIGSNYGEQQDPNAKMLTIYLDQVGESVATVVNHPRGKAELGRASFSVARQFLSARTVCYTHSLSDVLPHAHRLFIFKRFFNFPQMVFLQHGVIGLKKELSNGVSMSSYISMLAKTFDYMLVSSAWEKKIVRQMGVHESKLAVTGLPRFDRYLVPIKTKKKILVFFTWQDSEHYEKKVDDIAQSAAIAALKRNGYELCLITHNMQSKHTEGRLSNDLDEHILDSEFLITDDSSVAWDFFYSSREVIFYKPNKPWLVETNYLNVRTCNDLDSLDCLLKAIPTSTVKPDPTRVFSYADNNNSARVYELFKNTEDF
jgi:CDP-glycerol glycerophosphotransferase (TagB/SpsB family)